MPQRMKKPMPLDQTYLDIWKIEQDHSRTRWTVTTFFLSISFAILGLSFDKQEYSMQVLGFAKSALWVSLPDVQRIIGLFIFWFGYALFVQFNRYSTFLRHKMKEMEEQKQVSFTFQSQGKDFMYSKIRAWFSASMLLFYFGLLYIVIVVFLAFTVQAP